MKELNVLVIEARASEFSRMIENSIKSFGLNFHRESSLAGGVQVLRTLPIELILLDLDLPDAAGISGIVRLKAEFPEIAVVVIAEYDDPNIIDDSLKNGAEDFLVKGKFSQQRLERVIRCAQLKKTFFSRCFELQGRLRLATSILPICMWISRDGRTVYNVVGSLEKFFGGPVSLWNGQKILDMFGGLEESVVEDLKACIERAKLGESTRLVVNHGNKWLEFYIVGVFEGNQGVIHGLVTDVTNIKESEIRYREAQLEMERIHKAKAEFLESISHDLRTPLNGIIGAAQLLRYRRNAKTHENLVQNVLACSENLLAIIDDVLELGFVQTSQYLESVRPFDATKVVQSCVDTIEALARDKGLAISVEVDEKLGHVKLRSPERALRRLLINLLGNAIKYSDSGVIKLSLRLEWPNDTLPVLVGQIEDSGIGIPKAIRLKLFEANQSVFLPTSGRGGTGLGLVICKRILDGLNGEIKVDSEIEVGTTFEFRYPVEVLKTKVVEGRQAVDDALEEVPFHGCGRKVLVVDDLEENRFVLTEIIRLFGFSCDAADGAEEAAELFKKNCYTDVFMDMRMPKVDGFDGVVKLRALESDRDCPPSHIVAVTATNTDEYRIRCKEVGCDEFIPKPITMGRLKEYFAQ